MEEQEKLTLSTKNEGAPLEDEGITIDLGRIFRSIWHYIWVVILAAVACGALAFGYVKLFEPELYQCSIKINVYNNVYNSESNSASSGEAAYLVQQYIGSTSFRNYISSKMPEGQSIAGGSISSSIIKNGVTRITVTSEDAQKAWQILNVIDENVATYIWEETQEMQKITIIEHRPASAPTSPSSPNVFNNVVIGAFAGVLISCLILVIKELSDNNIYQDEYLIDKYGLPVLANIPDADEQLSKKHRYYRYRYHYHYGHATQQTEQEVGDDKKEG